MASPTTILFLCTANACRSQMAEAWLRHLGGSKFKALSGGDAPDSRKVKATIHWVLAEHALAAEVRMYEHLFTKEDPNDIAPGQTYRDNINLQSLETIADAKVEPSLRAAGVGTRVQFERQGYFCVDPDSTPAKLVFNRMVTLKDSWAKIEKKG